MEHLSEISIEQLQDALDSVEGTKEAKRLMAAIAYKNGITQTELAEWYGVQRRTIYSWLKRLESEQLAESVRDEHRSGRPRKLSDTQQKQLHETLHEPPSQAGYDVPVWTPNLLQRHLEETFDVSYSRPSCRRLLKEAGLRYQQPHPAATDAENAGDRKGGGWVPE